MGKQTKRARKFVSSGGVKGRLQKGTITNKGKFTRGRKRGSSSDARDGAPTKHAKTSSISAEIEQKRQDDDMLSEKNLGDLDIETFFSTVVEDLEADDESNDIKDDEDNDNDHDEDDENNDNDDDEDDESDDSSENDEGKGATKGKKTQKARSEANDEDSSDSSEHEDAKAKTKKSAKEKKSTKKESLRKSSEIDSDSEESDIKAAEQLMKKEMSNLKSKDPEFHQFLKENEESLLEYGNVEEESGDEEDVESKEAATREKDEESKKEGSIRLTSNLLKRLEQGAFKSHGIKSLKKLINAYKSACHSTSQSDGDDDKKGSKYIIDSPAVFDKLMLMCLNRCHEEFHFHLLGKGSTEKRSQEAKNSKVKSIESTDDDAEEDIDPNKPINPKLLEKSIRWPEVKPILFTFLKSTVHVVDEAKDPGLVAVILKALSNFVQYMTPFPRLAEIMLKTLTGLWSAPIDASEDYQVVRLHSFLRIRQLALTQPFPFIEESLKKIYLAYAQRAKFATGSSVTSVLPTLTFMGNCVVELYSLDYHSSYQHAFIYIRQLALHLRTAMQKKTQQAFGTVYCWQFLHCLKLWVAVLTEACQAHDGGDGSSGDDQLMRSLLFPLTQVIIGTARLVPSTRYLPLRLHCVRLLQQLAAASQMFIPTTSLLMEVFDMKEVMLQPKKAEKGRILSLALTLRLRADNPLRTMEELEMCISDVFVLLNREIDLYQYSAGFPEFSVTICNKLRKFAKQTRQQRWRAYAKGCLEACERYAEKAIEERAKLNDIAPKDVKQLEILRPVNEPTMTERHAKSLEKEKRLEAASRPLQKQKQATATNKEEQEDRVETKKSKKSKKKKPNGGKLEAPTNNQNELDEEDEIQEGVDWSDEE